MDVYDVVENFIGENRDKYDGLCIPDECACDYEDLAHCGGMRGDCILGYRLYDESDDICICQGKRPKQPREEVK